MYSVKQAAEIAGVTVRTLHHYDQIGLLKPEMVNDVGYRFYSNKNLERLQQVLFFRELDFSLSEIKEILDHPSFNPKQTLLSHKEILIEKKKRLEQLIQTVETTILSLEGEKEMSKKDMFDGFDISEIEKHKEKYKEETKEKYGHTDAYKESQQKTSQYTKDDWAQITARGDEIDWKIVENMDKGPASEEVQELIAQKRQYITDNFYNCTLEIFRGLGEMYVADVRFTKNIDKKKEGLSEFLRQAMNIYCDIQEGK